MHSLISPDLFLTGTRFETHSECLTLKIILASNSFLTSLWIKGSNFGCIFLKGCWYSLIPDLMWITCWIILVSYVFRYSYVQEKTSLYHLKILINLFLSSGEQHFPKLMHLGFVLVPKLINLNCKDELWVFTFAGLLNFSFKSNIRSKVLTPLGMKLLNLNSVWCYSSSIMAPLKFLSFVKNSIIC